MDLQEIVIEEPEPEKVTPVQEPVFVPKPVVLPEFHFSGVLILSSRKSALISVENSEPVWVDLNDLILDWKLYAISPNYVELINEDETIRLFLHSDE